MIGMELWMDRHIVTVNDPPSQTLQMYFVGEKLGLFFTCSIASIYRLLTPPGTPLWSPAASFSSSGHLQVSAAVLSRLAKAGSSSHGKSNSRVCVVLLQ